MNILKPSRKSQRKKIRKEGGKIPDFLLFLFIFVRERSYTLFHPITIFRETFNDLIIIIFLKIIVFISCQERILIILFFKKERLDKKSFLNCEKRKVEQETYFRVSTVGLISFKSRAADA